MAKEKAQLDASSGKDMAWYLGRRIDDYEFQRNLVHGTSRHSFDQLFECVRAFKEIEKRVEKLIPREGAPLDGWEMAIHDLREWILNEITPEGWTRILAARRKETQAMRNSRWKDGSTTQILTTRAAAWRLSALAERYEIDRSELLSKLSLWLDSAKAGRAAFAEFVKENKLKEKSYPESSE